MERLIRSIFSPPDDPMRSRLARRYSNEVSIFLGENNTIYVNHICLTGSKDPGVLINMLWQAMQLSAMKSGLTLRMPQEAAAPAELVGHVEIPVPPPGMENRPMTHVAYMQDEPANGVPH
jgi:hypothetical protein